MIPGKTTRLAANFLLNELQRKEELLLSSLGERLRDESRDDVRQLLEANGIEPGLWQSGREGLVGAIKEEATGEALCRAAGQLEEQGLVVISHCKDDGWNERSPLDEDDFRIAITQKGRLWFTEPFELGFYDTVGRPYGQF